MTNDDQEEFWSKSAGPAWVALQSQLDALMQPVLDLVFEHAGLGPGDHVLDIGCGTGASVAQAVEHVGLGGHVTGVDISDSMLSQARTRLDHLENITLKLADAQIFPFETGRYDALISRFGMMFFEDSVAALSNMSDGLVPGGSLTFAAWGPAPQNPFFMEPAAAATALLGPMPKVDRTLPGPFAFEDTSRVLAMMKAARLAEISAETHDLFLTPEGDLHAVGDLCCRVGPADAALQYHDGTTADPVALSSAIATRFAGYDGPMGVRIPASINLFRARKST